MSERIAKRPPPKEGELLGADTGNLLNQATVQILIERNKPDEIKEIMQAELDFNRERFAIIREHEEKHPDAIEARRDKRFRRIQYLFLMGMSAAMLAGIMLIKLDIALSIPLVGLMTILMAGIVINGRDRDNDAGMLIELIEKLAGKEK